MANSGSHEHNGETHVENIKIETKGNQLIITIDASQDLGMSKSGKTRLVASTQGNQKINIGGTDLFLGINAYRK
jgi:hypothetical protein